MGKTIDTQGTGQGYQGTSLHPSGCFVSYTLNNVQPVRSTIIGDQPMFYMDMEEFLEEDYEDFLLEELDGSIETLRARLEACERFSDESAGLDLEGRIFAFRDQAEEICAFSSAVKTHNAPQAADISDVNLMESLLACVSKSRFAESLLAFASARGVKIILSNQTETALYERECESILLNPALGREIQTLLLVRELRRVWQHGHGALIHPLTFFPDHAVLVNRIQNADLTVSMVRSAWECQLAGEKDVWNWIESSPMADLAHVFAREAFLDFRTINNGMACAATFESWFLSERCRKQDRNLIQLMLADYQGYVFGDEQFSLSASAELISAIGDVPFGKNYLSAYARTILSDPVFTDVRDRANANFLWFIKFESSFRETERNLQNSSGTSGHDSRHGTPKEPYKEHAHEHTARVVTFPRGGKPSGDSLPVSHAVGSGVSGAHIIAFPCRGA